MNLNKVVLLSEMKQFPGCFLKISGKLLLWHVACVISTVPLCASVYTDALG